MQNPKLFLNNEGTCLDFTHNEGTYLHFTHYEGPFPMLESHHVTTVYPSSAGPGCIIFEYLATFVLLYHIKLYQSIPRLCLPRVMGRRLTQMRSPTQTRGTARNNEETRDFRSINVENIAICSCWSIRSYFSYLLKCFS